MISLLGSTLGVLVNLGNLSGLDQPVDGLGTTDGVADGRHAALGNKGGLGSLDVLDAGALELLVDVLVGDLELELAGQGVESEGLASDVVSLLVQVGDERLEVRPFADSQVSSVMPRADRFCRKFWPSSEKTDCS